jgi:hypothetical protein
MLPMILGFLGSAFAPAIAGATGISALASPLLAGAIGSGLGTAVETGDIGAGIKSGLGSFFGGKLLGGLMGSTAGAAGAGAAGGALPPGVSPTTSIRPMPNPANVAPKTGLAGLFGQGAVGEGLKSGMNFMQSAEGIGSAIGSALTAPKPTVKLPGQTMSEDAKNAAIEMKPIPRQQRTPPTGYRPGIDPEFNYGLGTPYSYGDILAYRDKGVLPYAEGGEIEMDEDTGEFKVETERPVAGNEKTEIVDAISAIKGQHPQPEVALGKFLAKYGEDALRDLVDSVQSGEFDDTRERFENGENGMVRGPGDGSGVDDKVPATIDGEQDVLLADGEFVLRKDATDALEKKFGGGFLSAVNSAGDKAPEVLKKKAAA